MSAYAAWHQMVPICMEWWCTEANEATQTHCCNPVAPAYPIWAYYVHGRQCRCQEDPVGLPSGRLEKTTRSSPHYMAQHCPTDLKQHHLMLPKAADLAQNRPLWRMMLTFGATRASSLLTSLIVDFTCSLLSAAALWTALILLTVG